MTPPTSPKLIAADIAGSSMTESINDYRRDKAVRKLIYFNPQNKQALLAHIRGSSGERYAVANGATDANGDLVHPEKTDLPLQSIDVIKIGQDRWMATLNYFRIPSGGWGGSNANDILQMRTTLEPMRVYTDGSSVNEDEEDKDDDKGEGKGGDDKGEGFVGGGGGGGGDTGDEEEPAPPAYDWMWAYAIPGGNMIMPSSAQCGGTAPRENCGASPNSYSRVVQIPQVKLHVPFAETSNPFTNAGYVGGVNLNSIRFGGNLWFRSGQVRFDGVQMTDQGSAVTTGGIAARYVGFYEFTATPTSFYHQVPYWAPTNEWAVKLELSNVNINGSWSSLAALGL